MITPGQLRSWIIEDRPDMLVINKPPHIVCHPSKNGPWSSLIGACRELLAVERLHMPFRLDRETSGVVLVVKDASTAARMQKAVQDRFVSKEYIAFVRGELDENRLVEEPLGREGNPMFFTRQWVREDGRPARTEFVPLESRGGYTMVRVVPHTGRLHQIRVHAAWLGYPIAGDKLYPDPSWMIRFIAEGFTVDHRRALLLDRQALHCAATVVEGERFTAPLPEDMLDFWSNLPA
jgi:23S rRNA pseudouridine1911/1915/1917 synthase